MNSNHTNSFSNTSSFQNTRSNDHQIEEARETVDSTSIKLPDIFIELVLFEISQILNCGLDKQKISILASLCENGVNPEALAMIVKELQTEAMALKVCFLFVNCEPNYL